MLSPAHLGWAAAGHWIAPDSHCGYCKHGVAGSFHTSEKSALEFWVRGFWIYSQKPINVSYSLGFHFTFVIYIAVYLYSALFQKRVYSSDAYFFGVLF